MRNVIAGIFDDTITFIERRTLDDLLQIRLAIEESKTWGEFFHLLPPHIASGVKSNLDASYDPEQKFETDEVPGYADGGWPAFPNQLMIDFLPRSVIAMGKIESTIFDGDRLNIPERIASAACSELRRLGWNVERDDQKVIRAVGLSWSLRRCLRARSVRAIRVAGGRCTVQTWIRHNQIRPDVCARSSKRPASPRSDSATTFAEPSIAAARANGSSARA